MTNSTNIANRINNFDFYYGRSDCHSTYKAGLAEHKSIIAELEELSNNELIQVKEMITVSEDTVNSYFGEFFENLEPEVTETKKTFKSQLFETAWFYLKKGIYLTFSECLKAAWKAYKVVKKLKKGVTTFSFRKVTGEIREATGTLNGDLFEYNSKGTRQESKPDAIKYFDIEKQDWRMFRIERLLSVA